LLAGKLLYVSQPRQLGPEAQRPGRLLVSDSCW